IGAALVMAEVAALAKRDGVTLQDRLDDIASRFGRHITAERSLRMMPAEQSAAMDALRADAPTHLAGRKVANLIDRRDGNVLLFELDGGARLLVRPSGTEPKVKIYAETVGDDPEPLLDALAALMS
ncbi:MAG: phospho-sugar mutase, partial [Acidimicrobiia bacterium]